MREAFFSCGKEDFVIDGDGCGCDRSAWEGHFGCAKAYRGGVGSYKDMV